MDVLLVDFALALVLVGLVALARPLRFLKFAALEGSLARAVMNFHVEAARGGVSQLVTETRVATTDRAAERAFARYWRVIYPGSALIRRMWLRAIKTRAEAGVPNPVGPGRGQPGFEGD